LLELFVTQVQTSATFLSDTHCEGGVHLCRDESGTNAVLARPHTVPQLLLTPILTPTLTLWVMCHAELYIPGAIFLLCLVRPYLHSLLCNQSLKQLCRIRLSITITGIHQKPMWDLLVVFCCKLSSIISEIRFTAKRSAYFWPFSSTPVSFQVLKMIHRFVT